MSALGCNYQAPTFGAHYPDGTCFEGFMWDLDSGDSPDALTHGGDIPCPWCNTASYLEYQGRRASGNARQRRAVQRTLIVKVRAWAEERSSFPPAAKEPQ